VDKTIIYYRLLWSREARIADAEQSEAGDKWTKR